MSDWLHHLTWPEVWVVRVGLILRVFLFVNEVAAGVYRDTRREWRK